MTTEQFTGKLERTIEDLLVSTFGLAFSPDGRLLASAGADRIVYIWNTENWKIVRKLTGLPEMVSQLVFSPEGTMLLSGGGNEFSGSLPASMILWDVSLAEPKRTVPSAHWVRSMAFSPDGKLVASVDYDKTVSIWAVAGAH